MRRFLHSRPVIGGLVILIVGLAYAVEGGFLTAVGGDWVYLALGVGYVLVGALLLLGTRWALWINAAVFLATIIWTISEVEFGPYAVFAWLPRIDVGILICWYLMLPWVWRRLDRGIRPLDATAFSRVTLEPVLGAFVPGTVAFLLFVTGAVVVVTMPFSKAPAQSTSAQTVATSFLPDFGVKPADWPAYGRTRGGSRYSPLKQITRANVSQLAVAWTYRSGDVKFAGSGPGEEGLEATPIKVDNTLYTCTPNGWVIALNPVTGKQIWKWKPQSHPKASIRVCRGVSYYQAPAGYQAPDGSQICKTRIFAPQGTPTIVALDARTGKPCPGFGDGNGLIDLTQHMGRVWPGALFTTSPLLVMDNTIVVGGSVTDNWFAGEPSGVIRAFNAVTGKPVWHWDLGKKNPNAPLAPGATYTRYTPNSWGVMTGDPTRGIVYAPLGNATPDFVLEHRRPFDKKYSGSTVALDIKTGKELWDVQYTHSDVYDFDVPIGPTLVNWPNGHGGTIPALVQTTKFGQFYVLNRVTGKAILPIEEKPVTRGPKDGPLYQQMSKTQPFSTGMPALTPKEINEADMWGITPFDQMWCRIQFNKLYYDGYFTPPTTQGSIMYPTFDGVVDWYGASITPDGKLVAMANYMPYNAKLIPRAKAVKQNMVPKGQPGTGSAKPKFNPYGAPPSQLVNDSVMPMYNTPFVNKMGPMMGPLDIPCINPPFATLNMIDLGTQKLEWSIPLGTTYYTQIFHIDHTFPNTPTNLPLPTGVYGFGAAALTQTGLAFIAGSTDRKIRAVDIQTGKVLWANHLPVSATSTPSIYKGNNGCEYVVVSAGGHDGMYTKPGDYTIAYALPQCINAGS